MSILQMEMDQISDREDAICKQQEVFLDACIKQKEFMNSTLYKDPTLAEDPYFLGTQDGLNNSIYVIAKALHVTIIEAVCVANNGEWTVLKVNGEPAHLVQDGIGHDWGSALKALVEKLGPGFRYMETSSNKSPWEEAGHTEDEE